jgi:putative transposase
VNPGEGGGGVFLASDRWVFTIRHGGDRQHRATLTRLTVLDASACPDRWPARVLAGDLRLRPEPGRVC